MVDNIKKKKTRIDLDKVEIITVILKYTSTVEHNFLVTLSLNKINYNDKNRSTRSFKIKLIFHSFHL